MKNFFLKNKLSLILIALLIAPTIYIVQTDAPQLSIPVICSLGIITLVIALIKNNFPKLSRILLFLYSLILSAQLVTITLTGNYIDTIALSNLDEYTSISQSALFKIIFIIGLYLICTVLIKLPQQKNSRRFYLTAATFLIVVAFLSATQKNNLPISNFLHLTYTTSLKYYQYQQTDAAIKQQQKKLYGKDFIVEQPQQHLISPVPNLQNKNVIVFFSEALSAKTIDLFNNYSDLTPNLSAFIQKSLFFENYYNHTFATYRGLRGQLSSSYQYTGGTKVELLKNAAIARKFTTELVTLPQILNQNNYHTYFLSGRSSSPSNLNRMLSGLGFEHIFTPEDFGRTTDLSDQQLFEKLTVLLTENKLKEPFFIGIYNVGTHFAENSPDLKYKDGKNALLNTIHNFDNAFGRWFNTIMNIPTIHNNLAIILTADHAAFASADYRQTLQHETQAWVDRIPLAVYHPQIAPQIINAQGKNSLDLAPTILHMLRINNAKNYFLGCSLFKLYCSLPFEHYSAGGEIYYKTTPDYALYIDDKSLSRHMINKITDFYHLSEALSSTDNTD